MKKNFIIIIILIIVAQKSYSQDFKIECKIKGVSEGSAYLKYEDPITSKILTLDSCKIYQEQFSFKGNTRYPKFGFIVVSGLKDKINLWIEPGISYVYGNAAYIQLLKINGGECSTVNKEFFELSSNFQLSEKRFIQIAADAEKRRDTTLLNFVRSEYIRLITERDLSFYSLLKKYPSSPVSAYQILQKSTFQDLETLLLWTNVLSLDLIEHPYYLILEKKIVSKGTTEIGSKIPDFTLNTIENEKVRFSDIIKTNKYTFIDFWASWCKPCLEQMPYVNTAYLKFKEKGFEVIAVSIDNKRANWEKSLISLNPDWVNVAALDDLIANELMNLFSFRVIPANYLIDSNGIIVGKNLHGEDLEKKLSELLKD
jgi:thiol-disulfide isomerase/thioredoxin